jgi:hypothetical protein
MPPCLEATAVEAGEGAGDSVGEEGVVPGGDKEFGDAPDVLVGGHTVAAVEAGEVTAHE